MTHVHFMGIGGSGVSGLALMAARRGHTVSGCDLRQSEYMSMVASNDISCVTGHSPDHLESVDIVVRSSAVPDDAPELIAARKKPIPVFTRGEYLVELLRDETFIGITGSHGKTTTTWMLHHLFRRIGQDASLYAGGKSCNRTTHCGIGPWIVELDESDGSVFSAFPDILVVNNLEMEHPDFYRDEHDLKVKFQNYINIWRKSNTALIVGGEYRLGRDLIEPYAALTFPRSEELLSRQPVSIRDGAEFIYQGNDLYFISNYGEFYVGDLIQPPYLLQNKCAAMLAFHEYFRETTGAVPAIPRDVWDDLPKIERRFHVEGRCEDVTIISDYAHHPSELDVVLRRALNENMNFGVVFQPHRLSRFRRFFSEFEDVLGQMDPIFILPTFGAGETVKNDPARELVKRLRQRGRNATFLPSIDEGVCYMRDHLHDLRVNTLVFAGAGDIDRLYGALVDDEA